jgi:hypothetical protein
MPWRIDPKTLVDKAKDNRSLSIFAVIVVLAILAKWLGA